MKDKNISVALRQLGIPPSLSGFDYCMAAIKLIFENKDFYRHFTVLYSTIGRMYNTTGSRVERAMRTAIEVAFKYAGSDILEEIFANSYSPLKGKPTTKEFLCCICEYLKYEEDAHD